MATITLSDSSNYVAGVPAVGINVRADLDAIIAQCNTNLDGENIAPLGVGEDSLAAGAVTATKLGANSVYEGSMYYGETSGGVNVVRAGPDYAGSGAPRLVRCSVTYTGVVAGAGWETETDGIGPHDFSTICVDGNPGFLGVPTMMGTPVVTANDGGDGDLPDIIAVNAIASDSITLAIHYPAAATVQTFTIEWGMLGQLSV